MESERWAPPKPCGLMRVGDADSKKCQISVVQMAKKPWHTLINTRGCPSLAVISLGQAVVFNT